MDFIQEQSLEMLEKDYTRISISDNGHKIYNWSDNLKERLLQFWYQLNRTNSIQIQILKTIMDGIIIESLNKIKYGKSETEKMEGIDVLVLLYRVLAHTRDIKNGKGEMKLSYMMIKVWYDFFPEAALNALELFVKSSVVSSVETDGVRPFGSWKDVKYFCNYCKNDEKMNDIHPLIIAGVQMLNKQIKKDIAELDKNGCEKNISYAAKWVPREKSNKFGWQFEILAKCYYPEYFSTAITSANFRDATNKAKMNYRKIVSKLNRFLETPQINMCNDLWDEICLRNLTSRTIFKNQNALLNVNKKGEQRFFSQDRVNCAEQFSDFIDLVAEENQSIKGREIELYEYVKNAYEILDNKEKWNSKLYNSKCNLLNAQWSDYLNKIEEIKDSIAFIDFSLSIDQVSLYNAIGLACLIMEKNDFGKGVVIYSSEAIWINLDGVNGFVNMINKIRIECDSRKDFCRSTSNIYNAFDSILNVFVKNKIENQDFSNLNFIVLSNMKFERDKLELTSFFHVNIENMFINAGISAIGKEYNYPYIILWNLDSTNEFVTTGVNEKMSIVSGFRPSYLNMISKKCIQKTETITPWEVFLKVINHKRYDNMEFFMRHILTNNKINTGNYYK